MSPTEDPAEQQAIEVETGARTRVDLEAAFPDPPPEPPRGPAGFLLSGDAPAERMVGDDHDIHPTTSFEGANSYQKEHELKMLHRFLMRNTRIETAARALNKTLDETRRMRRILWRRMRVEAENLDLLTHAGRTLAYYDEIRGIALRAAGEANASILSRMRALDTSLKAENDKHDFLYRAGFYGSTKFTPKPDVENDAAADARMLGNMAHAMLDPSIDDDMVREMIEQASRDRDDLGDDDLDNDVNLL